MSTAESKVNFIVIMTDDHDAMGSIEQAMPELQALAAEGVTFKNAFVAQPVCAPNRTSFLTGQYPHNHGVNNNPGAYETFTEREVDSIGPWMQAAGYTTGFMGKYLGGYQDDALHVPPGWNDWRAMTSPRYVDFVMNENGELVTYSADDYSTDVISDHATAFIASAQEPFFLSLAPMAPHSNGHKPAIPAARHAGIFDGFPVPRQPNFNEQDVSTKPAWVQELPLFDDIRIAEIDLAVRKRREALRAVDEMIGSLRDALAARGNDVRNRTVIIFTSDNGFSEGSHRWFSKGVPYEESIRVPLIIAGRAIPEGEARGHLVSTIDITAYILQRAGATPTDTLDGRSFAPILVHPIAAPWRRALLVTGVHGSGRWTMVRTQRYSYVKHHSTYERELYDVATDPAEFINLQEMSGGPALDDEMHQLSTCEGETCWIPRAN